LTKAVSEREQPPPALGVNIVLLSHWGKTWVLGTASVLNLKLFQVDLIVIF